MSKLRAAIALLTASIAVLALPSGAAGATLVASWNFTPVGSIVADSAGTNEAITLGGPWVIAAGAFGDAVAFTGANAYGKTSGSSAFNPGTAEFAVTARFRTTRIDAGSSPNVAQHGLFSDSGQYKVQLNPKNGGIVQCRLKGTGGERLLSSTVLNVDDGAWHVATCWRTATRIGVTVDGVTTSQSFALQSLSNTRPFFVGNKSATGGAADQFFGDLDCVTYATGSGAQALAAASSAC
jgi:hypothetical protein